MQAILQLLHQVRSAGLAPHRPWPVGCYDACWGRSCLGSLLLRLQGGARGLSICELGSPWVWWPTDAGLVGVQRLECLGDGRHPALACTSGPM